MKKIILINILLFLFTFITVEIISYQFLYGHLRKYTTMVTPENLAEFKIYSFNENNILKNEFVIKQRNDNTLYYDASKNPILTVGCSYAYGQGIKIDKIFASQIQQSTKIKTINVSRMGSGADDVLKSISHLEKKNFLKENQFNYVIYVMMFDHIARVHDLGLLSNYLTETYKKNKNKSNKEKFRYYLDHLYTIKFFNTKHALNNNFTEEIGFEYLKYLIIKINEIIKRNNPDTKLIVLLYDDITNHSEDSPSFEDKARAMSIDTEIYSDLEIMGIQFISTKELVGDILHKEEYQLLNDEFQYWRPHHPNEKAWEVIVPPLIKKLNL